MDVYVVHEEDWHRYPILGIFTSREAAEMLMMEHGWHRNGSPKTFCSVRGLDGAESTEEQFTIGTRHYVGGSRRGRVKVQSGGLHRVPIDCLLFRFEGQHYDNVGLTIVGDEGRHEADPGQEPGVVSMACVCSAALIVEGPAEAWNEYLAGGWDGERVEPEWLD